MTNPKQTRMRGALRERAEQRIQEGATSPQLAADADTISLLHEMSVYEIELELQNEELRLAREAAESALEHYKQQSIARSDANAANLAKSQFLANISHEIRTPLNGMMMAAELLKAPNLADVDRLRYAGTIQDCGKSLLALLNDILDLSAVEADKIELLSAPIDPKALGQEVTALFGEAARAKGLEIESVWLGPQDACYMSDPFRIRQMLSNLVSNAIKFTAQGYVHMEACETERDAATGQAVLEFSVSDSGIGIPPDKIALLFKRFSIVDNSTTRVHQGAGLGLSIVSGLARKMGGDVGVESTPGKGSRFYFRIRCGMARAAEVDQHVRPLASIAPPADFAGLAGMRVLVVEDAEQNRLLMARLLAKFGIESECVENGEQAVNAILGGGKPSLVMMDLHMPVMDGLEATRRIRQWEREHAQPNVPIIALTGAAFAKDREDCMSAGMNDFLAKPFDRAQLQMLLQKWISSREVS